MKATCRCSECGLAESGCDCREAYRRDAALSLWALALLLLAMVIRCVWLLATGP